jgi:S-adenosylmethionine decarboxylase
LSFFGGAAKTRSGIDKYQQYPAKKRRWDLPTQSRKGTVVTMKALGRHIVAEFSFCNPEVLGDLDRVRDIMVTAALAAKAEIKEMAFHKFSPQGVSGVVVLAESHIAIHTWPERAYAAIDTYTCGDKADPLAACDYMAEQFEAGGVSKTVMERGIPTPFGYYSHMVSSSYREAGSREGGVRVAQTA